VLRRKTIAAEASATQQEVFLRDRYPALQPQVRQWLTLRAQIAQKTLSGPQGEERQAHRLTLASWTIEKERLEAAIARRIPEMNLEQHLRKADRRAVALALPDGVTLVEFVRSAVFDFHAVAARGEP